MINVRRIRGRVEELSGRIQRWLGSFFGERDLEVQGEILERQAARDERAAATASLSHPPPEAVEREGTVEEPRPTTP